MKIAVCLSGQARKYRECAHTLFEHLLRGRKADIYISTWTMEGGEHTWDGKLKNADRKVNAKDLRARYKPKALKIEDDLPRPASLGTHWPMWYKIWDADMLRRESGIAYDIVIRARLDEWFRPDCQLNFEELKSGVLYVSAGYSPEATGEKTVRGWDSHSHRVPKFKKTFANDYTNNQLTKPIAEYPPKLPDQFAVGSPDVIETYANGYLFVRDWLADPNRGEATFPMAPEPPRRAHSPQDLQKYMMWIYNIPVIILSSIKYCIKR